MPQRLLRLLPAALVVAGLLACVAGLLLQRMWLALPWPRLLDQLVMGALALGRIPYEKWLKFVWKLMLLFLLLTGLLLVLAAALS